MPRRVLCLLAVAFAASPVKADPPVASYVFPAGGQRGTNVKVRVGGLYLHERCSWSLTGAGLTFDPTLVRTATRWFEGPILPLPDSQRSEDYPQDMLGRVRIDAKAPLGARSLRLWTSEGAASGPRFVVGDLPEVVESEADGDPAPVRVRLPVTINGRIFPHENIDVWSFAVPRGQTVTCEVHAARIGSPLDSRLEVRGPDGRVVAENDDYHGADSLAAFTAPTAGVYQVRIQDAQRGGSQRHVYRLTITTGPHLRQVYPLGGRRGARVSLALDGLGLPAKTAEAAIPADASGIWSGTLALGKGLTHPLRLDVDSLPEESEVEPNNTDAQARKAVWPVVLNGRIDRPGDADVWRIAAKKGEVVAIDLRAARLGSRLDGIVDVASVKGAFARRFERDGEHLLVVPETGDYYLRVRDRFRSRGGPGHGYRLRVDRPRPNVRLSLGSETLTVARGKATRLRLKIDRGGGFAGPLALHFTGLPSEVKATPGTVPAGAAVVELTFQAGPKAPVGVANVGIRAVAKGPTGDLTASAGDLLVAVGLTAPFKLVGVYDLRLAPRGSVFRKRYKVVRNGYRGPLVAALADRQARHLQGVSGPRLTLAADQDAFDYPVTLPPWMEIGRTSRACVMLVGKVREGDAEHTVSATSQEQNEQMIAVVEAGRLGLELGRKSVAVVPGKSALLPVEIRRGKGLRGPVTIELLPAPSRHGVSAKKLNLAAGQSRGTLELHCAGTPGNLLATVRATLITPDGPVTAESAVELVRP
jgi:hypothetical protein